MGHKKCFKIFPVSVRMKDNVMVIDRRHVLSVLPRQINYIESIKLNCFIVVQASIILDN